MGDGRRARPTGGGGPCAADLCAVNLCAADPYAANPCARAASMRSRSGVPSIWRLNPMRLNQ